MKSIKKVLYGASALFLGMIISTGVFAQENQAKETKKENKEVKEQTQQQNWDEFKADLKVKYQKVMDDVSSIEKQASAKTTDASVELREHIDKFQEQAREFGTRMKETETIPADKQEAFRKEMNERLERLNKSYEEIKEKWAKMNK